MPRYIDIEPYERQGNWTTRVTLVIENDASIKSIPVYSIPNAEVVEVVRCKDCKWYGRADKRRFYRGMDCLQKRIDTIVPDKDFCSRAERRTDE